MTVSSAISKLSYNGDGSATPLATPQFVSNSDIVAILRDAAGVETTWVESTDYNLTGAGVSTGGTLTPIATPPAVGEKLIIFRDPPIVQGSEYPVGGPLPSSVIEANVDLLTFIAQRLKERVDRTLIFPETDTLLDTELPSSTARANKFFGFDSSGNPTAVAGTSANLGPVSVYIDTLLPALNAAAARVILDAAALTAPNTFTEMQRWSLGADVASATAMVLGTDGNIFTVTGTTNIASIGTVGVGTLVLLRFAGVLDLVHDNDNIVCQTGANIPTAAGDTVLGYEYATGKWRLFSYARADGTALVESPSVLVGQAHVQDGVVATGTTVLPSDDTIPQITEGDEYMTLAYTPAASANILHIDVSAVVANSAASQALTLALFRDAVAGALAAVPWQSGGANTIETMALSHQMTSPGTAPITFRVRIGGSAAGTTTFNGSAGVRRYGGVAASTITVREMLP